MNDILSWGLDVIRIIQSIRSDVLDFIFLSLTHLGGSIFIWLFFLFYYWCLDKKAASRLIILFLISNWLVSEFKNLFDQPRPYMLDASVKIGDEGGPGLPSGHAQNMIIVWVYLILQVKKRWFTAIAVALILLVSFSRIYLGLHFPTDIIGAWITGIILLVLFLFMNEQITSRLISFKFSIQVFLAVTIPCLLAMIQPNKWSVTSMAILAGFCVGYFIERRMIDFKKAESLLLCLTRYTVGVSVLILLDWGLSCLIPATQFFLIFLFIQYFMAGLWLSAGAPWVFRRFNL